MPNMHKGVYIVSLVVVSKGIFVVSCQYMGAFVVCLVVVNIGVYS